MLAQILSPEARERLARIRIVKEDKARGVEEMLIRMAQTGQIRGKVSEAALIDILGQVNESVASAASSKIKVHTSRHVHLALTSIFYFNHYCHSLLEELQMLIAMKNFWPNSCEEIYSLLYSSLVLAIRSTGASAARSSFPCYLLPFKLLLHIYAAWQSFSSL